MTDLYHLRRALESYARNLGETPGGLFEALLATLRGVDATIAEGLPAFGGAEVENTDPLFDDAPVPFRRAAQALDVTPGTIGEYVRRGRLDKVGRRVTRASIREFQRGER